MRYRQQVPPGRHEGTRLNRLDPIQIRRSDILQSYWFLVRPLGPNFLRYATKFQVSQFSVQFMVFIFGHMKEERRF